MIKAINPAATTFGGNSAASSAVSYNGLYFFMADDGVHGQELWSSDGTAAGTSMVADINPGSASAFDVNPFLTVVGNKLFFAANDGVHGSELWRLNYAPGVTDKAYSMRQGNPLTVSGPGILQGATDRDNDPLTAMLITSPAHGQLTLKPDGSFSYIPAAGFQGVDTFTYTARDPFTFGNLATITITVAPPLPMISVNSISLLEGKSGLTPFVFQVKLPKGASTNGPVTFDVYTSDGTAKSGVNYVPVTAGDSAHGGTVTFAKGATSATVIIYVIAGSLPVTPATATATFLVHLADPLDPRVALSSGTGTIIAQAGATPHPVMGTPTKQETRTLPDLRQTENAASQHRQEPVLTILHEENSDERPFDPRRHPHARSAGRRPRP